MAEYQIAFILTDSEMKKISENSDEVEIVKRANLTSSMMDDYVPFNLAVIVGEEDYEGQTTQKITGDKNKVLVEGVTMVGVMPLPYSTEYSVGENFTADKIFEVSADGSSRTKGYAKIEKIILSKTKTDLDEIINYCAEVNAAHGRPIMYAENVEMNAETLDDGEIIDTCYECANPIYMDDARCRNCGSWDVDSDAFGAEYEQHLIKMAHYLYPPHRMFEANV
ncbi:MAG: hypothetical protein HOC18_06730 [Candidatus Marinimicrobia bacterium]|nr:hypothetical protein [Candidatus Neomarinimicrobiota bacterium]